MSLLQMFYPKEGGVNSVCGVKCMLCASKISWESISPRCIQYKPPLSSLLQMFYSKGWGSGGGGGVQSVYGV